MSFQRSGRAQIIAVASGKGGVGKTNVSVNLAVALARAGGRVMLIDCDMGLANAAILMGIDATFTIGDLLAGRCTMDDLIRPGPGGISFVPGHSGTGSGSTLTHSERTRLIEALGPWLDDFDHVVIDTGSGIEASALALIAEADMPMIVVTPEPTSFIDAYALVKALAVAQGLQRFQVVANMVRHDIAGRELFDRFRGVVTRFLDLNLDYAGAIPDDPYVREAVLRKRCCLEAFPGSGASKAFGRIARRLARPDIQPVPAPAELRLMGEANGTY
ncbi:MinD/ParA family protein [Sphingosinicella sp. LHD-64]|uniref:MinD/ParA family protein n=1 Tax=Sphingosinicella sp. LHD-64 TaxID=3072139 RepID=UPI00280FC818|nr:MinD/ParA family protein [Sphingosinicella sp. LHD-64]MDQ8757175.1 MinD/ParA family protein [Sphingosinicella sp. LHD-64]